MNIKLVNSVDAINTYNPKTIKIQTTIKKYLLVSALEGHTTCFISLKESLKNCIIQKFLRIKKCHIITFVAFVNDYIENIILSKKVVF